MLDQSVRMSLIELKLKEKLQMATNEWSWKDDETKNYVDRGW